MGTVCKNILPALLPLFVLLVTRGTAQEKPSPRAQQIITAIEPMLPELEKAAAECEQALGRLPASSNPAVVAAVDSARLQIAATQSVRTIITQQPDYLTYHIGPGNLTRWKEGADYYLDCARTARDPFAGMTAGVRPFRSKIDGQLLLYRFTLPEDYDPARKYPLRIELHSGGGFTWLAYWVTGKPDASPRAASKDGAIHIAPAGRQHVGLGEIAILEAIADARRHFSIDDDRLIIGGASWGGTGGFHFGTLLPDRFAAAYSLTGGGNYNVPVGNGRFDAYLLGDNLSSLPFVIWDAPGDGHYKANHAFMEGLRQQATKHPGFYPHRELTDLKGGHGNINRALQDEGWAWMSQQVRNRYPKLVVYNSYSLRYDGAYWARFDTLEDATKPARIEAQIDAGGDCRVLVENSDRFHLDLASQLVGPRTNVRVRINDSEPIAAPAGGTVYFRKTGGQWGISPQRYPAGLIKRHGVSGPIQDVFMEHPVLLVYGSKEERSHSDVSKMLDGIVTRMFGPGDGSGVLRTGFERKSDGDVSEIDIAEQNLILVGTPRQNQLLAKIADRLPVEFLDDGVKIGNEEYRGENVGLLMVYPNPFNPQRYILLAPEQYGGDKTWGYPDYVVFQSPAAGQSRGRVLGQGTFDAHWQVPKKESDSR